jgi:hypothetical protein
MVPNERALARVVFRQQAASTPTRDDIALVAVFAVFGALLETSTIFVARSLVAVVAKGIVRSGEAGVLPPIKLSHHGCARCPRAFEERTTEVIATRYPIASQGAVC